MDLTGADVRTPRAAAGFLSDLASVYTDMSVQAGQFHSNQVTDKVVGPPLEFLAAMQDNYATAAAALTSAAARANDHCTHLADTIGSDPSLAETQDGYADVRQL